MISNVRMKTRGLRFHIAFDGKVNLPRETSRGVEGSPNFASPDIRCQVKIKNKLTYRYRAPDSSQPVACLVVLLTHANSSFPGGASLGLVNYS